MKVRWLVLSVMMVPTAALAAPASTAPAGNDIPQWHTAKFGAPDSYEFFGDARTVKLLGDLLSDKDPLVREQAVAALGETHNNAALALIKMAATDQEPAVRATAVLAAWQLSQGDYEAVIRTGLADGDIRVVNAALKSVELLGLAKAAGDVEKVLDRQVDLQSRAIAVLNGLGAGLTKGNLARMLDSRNAAVRLEAALNCLQQPSDSVRSVQERLLKIAQDDDHAVRAAAMAVLAKHAFDVAKPVLDAAAKEAAPDTKQAEKPGAAMLRQGLVRAYENAAKRADVVPFLRDPSPMVRLAAIRAAGNLKCAEAIARLLELLQEAPDDMAHQACKVSLLQIGTPETAAATAKVVEAGWLKAKALAQQQAASKDDKNRVELGKQLKLTRRNVRTGLWILGQMESAEAVDFRLQLVNDHVQRKEHSEEVLIEAAFSLGRLGDKRAVEPLHKLLGLLAADAGPAHTNSPPPNVRYSTQVAIATIHALAELGDISAVQDMDKLLNVTVMMSGRLNRESEAIMSSLPKVINAGNRTKIESMVLATLKDARYDYRCRRAAMSSAAQLKLAKAVEMMKQILENDRPNRNMMRMAAWAIQQISGEKLPVGDPKVSSPGTWIIEAK